MPGWDFDGVRRRIVMLFHDDALAHRRTSSLSHGSSGCSTNTSANYGTVSAANVMTDHGAGSATDSTSDGCVAALIKIGAAGNKRCQAQHR
jgi:hypothetical protein